MVRVWSSRTRDDTEIRRSALGGTASGEIAVILSGEPLDFKLVSFGCQMAKAAKRKIYLIHVIEVPRSLPLKAVLTQEFERADNVLHAATQRAKKVGCEAEAFVVQARDAGPAIVDEARDHQCALIFIGHVRTTHRSPNDLGKIVPYVLANAHCRVWFVQDLPMSTTTTEERLES